MCGIAGVIDVNREPVPDIQNRLELMGLLIAHRGPDGAGHWVREPRGDLGFAHRRLSVIDLSEDAAQPMTDGNGLWIVYNGEVYNFKELREELGGGGFRTRSDTEVILAAYRRWGADCVGRLRGMFAFAIWDEARQTLFCARDRFGIKPFYFTEQQGRFYFGSEAKALLPFMERIDTDLAAFKDYLTFQLCLGGRTLFEGVSELPPAHTLTIQAGKVRIERYWEVYYDLDFEHTARYFDERLRALLEDSARLHLRSDVPLGAYLSGGLDSTVVASIAKEVGGDDLIAFTGRFLEGPDYDESDYARLVAERQGFPIEVLDITADDFIRNIEDVIYHLDYPVAGPGSFSQYMVSDLASQHRKVVLGGQGGDEIFGGYARYLIAYFEQCIRSAIDGTMHDGDFVVTYESIIPNLTLLGNYKPLLKEFWSEGLFESMDRRYFKLIDRAPGLDREVRWDRLGDYSPFESFQAVFHGENVGKQSYFDLMTHFDFKTLLPALLQVEDRMSMAHGLESRVPLLDHPLVELAATAPADIKFENGTMKHLMKTAFRKWIPDEIANRKDKMGFPTPLTEWVKGPARDFVMDTLTSRRALERDLIDNREVARKLDSEGKFSRNTWGMLCLELWQQRFHDREWSFDRLGEEQTVAAGRPGG